jgi:hypothetical protein
MLIMLWWHHETGAALFKKKHLVSVFIARASAVSCLTCGSTTNACFHGVYVLC